MALILIIDLRIHVKVLRVYDLWTHHSVWPNYILRWRHHYVLTIIRKLLQLVLPLNELLLVSIQRTPIITFLSMWYFAFFLLGALVIQRGLLAAVFPFFTIKVLYFAVVSLNWSTTSYLLAIPYRLSLTRLLRNWHSSSLVINQPRVMSILVVDLLHFSQLISIKSLRLNSLVSNIVSMSLIDLPAKVVMILSSIVTSIWVNLVIYI